MNYFLIEVASFIFHLNKLAKYFWELIVIILTRNSSNKNNAARFLN